MCFDVNNVAGGSGQRWYRLRSIQQDWRREKKSPALVLNADTGTFLSAKQQVSMEAVQRRPDIQALGS